MEPKPNRANYRPKQGHDQEHEGYCDRAPKGPVWRWESLSVGPPCLQHFTNPVVMVEQSCDNSLVQNTLQGLSGHEKQDLRYEDSMAMPIWLQDKSMNVLECTWPWLNLTSPERPENRCSSSNLTKLEKFIRDDWKVCPADRTAEMAVRLKSFTIRASKKYWAKGSEYCCGSLQWWDSNAFMKWRMEIISESEQEKWFIPN